MYVYIYWFGYRALNYAFIGSHCTFALNDQNCYFKYMLAWLEAVCWRGLKCGVYIIGMVTSHRSMVTLGGRPTLRQGVVSA